MPEALTLVREQMAQAARRAGRDISAVKLVAVSKTQPAAALRGLAGQGQTIFGESYLGEAEEKIKILSDLPGLEWHFIGHLQSNKSLKATGLFSTIESLHSRELAERLNRQAGELGKKLTVLIQVSLAQEAGKSGCPEEDLPALAQYAAALPRLELAGLMTLPPFFAQPEQARPYFARLRELAARLAPDLPAGAMRELSMGMSNDFTVAIEEGATIIRLGTILFGERGVSRN
jgi:pyridoxal phosphate enzyme (YggS family)